MDIFFLLSRAARFYGYSVQDCHHSVNEPRQRVVILEYVLVGLSTRLCAILCAVKLEGKLSEL